MSACGLQVAERLLPLMTPSQGWPKERLGQVWMSGGADIESQKEWPERETWVQYLHCPECSV